MAYFVRSFEWMSRRRCFRPSWLYLTLQHWCLTLTPGDFPSMYPLFLRESWLTKFPGKNATFDSLIVLVSSLQKRQLLYSIYLAYLGTVYKRRRHTHSINTHFGIFYFIPSANFKDFFLLRVLWMTPYFFYFNIKIWQGLIF